VTDRELLTRRVLELPLELGSVSFVLMESASWRARRTENAVNIVFGSCVLNRTYPLDKFPRRDPAARPMNA
jgi:hypothetical protein